MDENVIEGRVGGLVVCIDLDRCIASGNCVKVAPQIFELDERHSANFRPAIEDADEAALREACNVCPVDALTFAEDAGDVRE